MIFRKVYIGFLAFICGAVTPLRADERALSYDECLNLARVNSRLQKISQADIAIAEQLLKQSRSSYWPTISARTVFTATDEDAVMSVPGLIQVKLIDKQNIAANISASLPLYTGGLRGAMTQKAYQNITAAREAARRTDLELTRNVQRFYYGAVMAHQLLLLADETAERMVATEKQTERLYKTGTGLVKKTDYLRVKSVNSMLLSTRAEIRCRYQKARTALNHAIGVDAPTVVIPSDVQLPIWTDPPAAEKLINHAQQNNPDIARIHAGIAAAQAGIKMARSAFYPKVGAFASYTHFENDLDSGLMDPINKDSSTIGLVLNMPLFEGFRTMSSLSEANKKLEKLKLQQDELLDGLRLQLELALIDWTQASEQVKVIKEGLSAARENRNLNERAYQENLVDTRDVIQSQLLESMLKLQQIQAQYECITCWGDINFIVGGQQHETSH